MTATSRDAVGAFMGAFHYVKLHPLFDSLPARCLGIGQRNPHVPEVLDLERQLRLGSVRETYQHIIPANRRRFEEGKEV